MKRETVVLLLNLSGNEFNKMYQASYTCHFLQIIAFKFVSSKHFLCTSVLGPVLGGVNKTDKVLTLMKLTF